MSLRPFVSRVKTDTGEKTSIRVCAKAHTPESKEFEIRTILKPKNPCGFYVRESQRGPLSNAEEKIFGKAKWAIPYVTQEGHVSLYVLAHWVTRPSSILSSVAATIFVRTRRYLRRHGCGQIADNITVRRLCIAQSVSPNAFLWDRALAIVRSRKTPKHRLSALHSVLCKYISKMDDNNWFVYGRASSDACWLTHGSKKPCAKSIREENLRRFEINTHSSGRSPPFSLYRAVVDVVNQYSPQPYHFIYQCRLLREGVVCGSRTPINLPPSAASPLREFSLGLGPDNLLYLSFNRGIGEAETFKLSILSSREDKTGIINNTPSSLSPLSEG